MARTKQTARKNTGGKAPRKRQEYRFKYPDKEKNSKFPQLYTLTRKFYLEMDDATSCNTYYFKFIINS